VKIQAEGIASVRPKNATLWSWKRELPSFIVVRVFVQIGVLLGWPVIALPEVSNNEKPSWT
jgi:hypothetical protein